MSHENNITKFFRNKKGMKVWYNELGKDVDKASRHPTKLNPRYLKTFKSEGAAVTEAKSISRSYDKGKK